MDFVERYNGCGLLIKAKEKIAEVTGLQKIEIFETESLGKLLVIDGKVQLTEFDEHFYHEMLVHVPMNSCKKARKVLIIGGGDGGALREVLKRNVARVVLVEIDRKVIELRKKHLGIERGAFDDLRVEIVIEDGRRFVENCENFDVIIVDSTDSVGVSDPLFGRDFFTICAEKSRVFCSQSQSPLIQKDLFRKIIMNSAVMENRRVFISTVPKTRHYNPEVHISAFLLPEWLKKEVKNALE